MRRNESADQAVIENLVIGVISGVISGLMVAFSLWIGSYYRKPRLELIHVAENRAVLKNNRPKAVAIGGGWELENGNVFFRPDGFRGGEGGFYIPRLGEFVVGTSYFRAGQTADVVYRYVKNVKGSQEVILIEESNIVEASEVVNHPEQYPQWQVGRISLKGVG